MRTGGKALLAALGFSVRALAISLGVRSRGRLCSAARSVAPANEAKVHDEIPPEE